VGSVLSVAALGVMMLLAASPAFALDFPSSVVTN
jgi:hypothetical protein